MGWSIQDRAGDMERGYSLNKTACKNARKAIEASRAGDKPKADNSRPKR